MLKSTGSYSTIRSCGIGILMHFKMSCCRNKLFFLIPAYFIGIKLAARLWGDRYQVIVATHLDRENHLHNHFVLNTVSFVDGIKYHRTAKDYHDMQAVSDELCREYGLSVIENPQYGKSKHYGEWRAEQENRPT